MMEAETPQETNYLPAERTYEIPEATIVRLKIVIEDLTRQNKELKEDMAEVLTVSHFFGKIFSPNNLLKMAGHLVRIAKNPHEFKDLLMGMHNVLAKYPDVVAEVDRRANELIKSQKIKV